MALSLSAVVLILADAISVLVRSVSESFDYLNVLGFLWLAPMGVNRYLSPAHPAPAWHRSRALSNIQERAE